jgi:tetratricopeptide (TPR) repeat protein
METGLSGHPLTPQLPTNRPGPLYHLLERLRTMGGEPSVRKLKCILDSLEFTERYYAGVAGGLLRKLEDPPNLEPLAHNALQGKGLRRLLRFCLNRLEVHGRAPGVNDLFSCFYLHGKRSIPYSHTRWMGLVPGTDTNEEAPNWSYREKLEQLSVPGAFDAMEKEIQNLQEVLQSVIEGGTSFFESHEHFARLDEGGWQCTLKKGDRYTELVPSIPTRLIPLEAQAPTSTPQTEDELLLSTNPFLPGKSQPEPGEVKAAPPTTPTAQTTESEAVPEEDVEFQPQAEPEAQTLESSTPEPDGDVPSARTDEEPIERWSPGELKSFNTSLQQVYPRLDLDRVPNEYLNKLLRFLSSVSSGYVLIEGKQGAGKSLLTQAFRDSLVDSSLDVTPLHFSVKNQFYPDTATFLEQLNESLRIRPGSGRKSFEALDPAVIKDLNLRSPGDARSSRFSSFLSELHLVNGTNIVLLLDGLDEGNTGRSDSLFSYLPEHLPDGVFVVVSYHPDRFRPGDKEIVENIHAGPSTKLVLSANDALYRDFLERFLSWGGPGPLSEGLVETLVQQSGGRLATAQHFLDGLRCELLEGEDDLPPAELVYEGLLDRLYERVPDRYLDLFLLLATSDEPVSGDELSTLGISRTDVLELVHSLPSLFHCNREPRLGLNLAHRALRLHIQRTFLTSYSQSCLRLGKRALRRLSENELAVLPVKEDLERLGETLRRLLRWAYDSQDRFFLAQVCSDESVGRLRRRVFAAMEERFLYHRKALVLDTFIRGLHFLVHSEKREEFREELAWSLSSRALSYYHLGQYKRAGEDIEEALKHFRVLVDEQGREELRNGLAAAYNRRSEIYRGLKDWSRALTDADRAVLNYESVVTAGREDLYSLWMLSRHNRAVIYRALKSFHQAESDLEVALTGYLQLVESENRRDLRPQLAGVYKTRALLSLDQGDLDYALTAANASLELLEMLVHQESYEHLRNELASVYNDRGAILTRHGVLDEAERDYASAVSIRTYLVAEGRIDVRTELANTYANRGLCLLPRGDYKEAQESFDRAVEILDRLIEEERREDLFAERAFALSCRGRLHRLRNQLEAAREDLTAAVADYRLAVVSQSTKHLEELATALNSLAEVSLVAGDDEVARKSCERVLEIFEEKLTPIRREAVAAQRAAAHHNLASALRDQGHLTRAEEEFQKAIELLTRLVESEGRPQLIGELATSLLRFAQLPSQKANAQLKLASRALALLKSIPSDTSTLLKVTEAYLLRGEAFRKMGSVGSALDDISAVLDEIPKERWPEPALSQVVVSALLERASLFNELEDQAASLVDLDQAAEVVNQLAHVLTGPEMDLRHCHILLERVRLLTDRTDNDFESSVELLRELDTRIDALPMERLSEDDYRDLRQRSIKLFKSLRLMALMPTRQENDYETTVERLTLLLKAVGRFRPNFQNLLRSDWVENQDVDPITKLQTQRGWSLVKQDRLEEALEDFEAAVDSLPPLLNETSPDVLEFVAEVESGRGAILDSLGREQEALEAYSRGVEAFSRRPESAMSPRRAACLNNRASLWQKLGHYQEALADLEPAIDIARSNYQRNEVLARCAEKAKLLRLLNRTEESLKTLKTALASGQHERALSPEQELPLQMGVFETSSDSVERFTALSRVLVLLRGALLNNPDRWRDEATRLLNELPMPESSTRGSELEGLIAETIDAFVQNHPVGYTPLTETILRRAARVAELSSYSWKFATLAAGLYCLATKLCYLEYQKYGERSLRRLTRCYLLTAQNLVNAESPRHLKGLSDGLEALTNAITLDPPTGELEVEINNAARLWLSLPPSKVLQAGISRSTLLKLRRW